MNLDINNQIEEHYEYCPECKNRIIHHDHELVCEYCGLVLNERKFTNSYQIREKNDSEFRSCDQYVSIGKTLDSVTNLGSNIDYANTNIFFDYKKKMLSSKDQKKYNKLKKHYFIPAKIKNHETDYRILKILHKIVMHLNLSVDVKNRAAYFYQSIKKKAPKIKNHVSLIAFCIFYSSRDFSNNAPISIQEICLLFQDYGHRITPRLIIRDNILYGHLIKKKNSPHKSEDFIPKFVDKVVSWPNLENRMKMKKSELKIDEYRLKLTQISFKILSKLRNGIRGCRNPYIMAATTVYCADRLLSKEIKSKKILTQSIASDAMEVPEYSIRDHYVKVFKPFFNL